MRVLRWAFFATLSLILMLQLRALDSDLRLEQTPLGIVGYELAWSADRANEMLTVWRRNDVTETARVSLGIDFVFLLAYPLMFFTGARLLARDPQHAFDRMGRALAFVVLACIPLDTLENVLLWRMITNGATDWPMHLATIAASAKFLVVLTVALWCVAAIVRRVITRSPSHSSTT
ncbi:MAG: hypothetical protein IT353_10400 [Gemmatimonadaceae bacterium]|nr:hypothetical protein [Gemmatimonadaceae bacterium]